MAEYNGKNNTTLVRNLAIERARYKLEAWGETIPEQVVDFNFAERTKYGRIDQDRNALVPIPQYLKTVDLYGHDQPTALLMNFVANAFNDMQDRLTKACRLGIISTGHPFLSSLEVYRSYISPIKLYREYMIFVLSMYNNDYLPSIQDHTPVVNFEEYWKNIVHFCSMMGSQFPITFTAWHRSKHSSVFTSGLAIDIAGLPMDDDAPKYDMFISSAEWNYYSNVAKYHGFSISHNVPWLLVADLKSPAMMEYMGTSGRTSEIEVFKFQYQSVVDFEIELLKDVLIDGYNNYALGYPYHKKVFVCDDFSLKTNIKERETTSMAFVNQKVSDIRFHIFYARIRNIEENSPFKKSDLARIIAKLKYFYHRLGPAEAMRYVNEQYRSLYKFKPGTTFYHIKRSQLRIELQEAEEAAKDRFHTLRSPDVLGVILPDPTEGKY